MDTSGQGKYAIHEAAREGRFNVVESLLNANPKLALQKDEDDRCPIHWAVSYNHLSIVELLVQAKNFDADVPDGLGWTPLMLACSRKDSEDLVRLLLSKGADVNAKNNNQQTALSFATSKNNLDVARILIEHKASVRVKDRRGQLPLHRAAAVGSVLMCQLLMENNSPLNASDMAGQTPLHHAIAEGHGEVALLLLKAGADSGKKDEDEHLAIALAPDKKVHDFIVQSAEREGLDLAV